MGKRLVVTYRVLPDGRWQKIAGRDAWALMQLVAAGTKGVTPIERPAPRWSAYIHNLRKVGLAIETKHESHGGPFPGTHGRYVLQNQVEMKGGGDAEAA